MQMKRTMTVLAVGALWAIVACAQQPAYQQPPAYQAPPGNQQQTNQSAPPAGQQPPAYQPPPPAGQQPPSYQQQPDQPPPGAREPTLNVSPYRHGNIARAQEYSRYAFDAMTQAQNGFGYYPIDTQRVLAIEVDGKQLGLLLLEQSAAN